MSNIWSTITRVWSSSGLSVDFINGEWWTQPEDGKLWVLEWPVKFCWAVIKLRFIVSIRCLESYSLCRRWQRTQYNQSFRLNRNKLNNWTARTITVYHSRAIVVTLAVNIARKLRYVTTNLIVMLFDVEVNRSLLERSPQNDGDVTGSVGSIPSRICGSWNSQNHLVIATTRQWGVKKVGGRVTVWVEALCWTQFDEQPVVCDIYIFVY